MCAARRVAHHATVAGYRRVLCAIFFQTATGCHWMNQRGLSISILCITSVAWVIGSAPAHAASINWGTPTNISGGSDVNTTGILFGAANNGGGGVTSVIVGGVEFRPFVTDGTASNFTSGNFTLSVPTTATKLKGSSFFGNAEKPFAALSPPSYKNLLISASSYSNAPLTLTLNNLSINQAYLVQLWVNFSDLTVPATETIAAGNSAVLYYNTTSTLGGLGQFVVGTFTADSPTQSITLTALFNPIFPCAVLNAVQLRTVPGPSISP
jgi:hypothetical protein